MQTPKRKAKEETRRLHNRLRLQPLFRALGRLAIRSDDVIALLSHCTFRRNIMNISFEVTTSASIYRHQPSETVHTNLGSDVSRWSCETLWLETGSLTNSWLSLSYFFFQKKRKNRVHNLTITTRETFVSPEHGFKDQRAIS